MSSVASKVFDKENMALRGLKITWVCIAILFISCSIIFLFEFKNSTFLLFPKTLFVLFLCLGKPIIYGKKHTKKPKNVVEQSIVSLLGHTNLVHFIFNVISAG